MQKVSIHVHPDRATQRAAVVASEQSRRHMKPFQIHPVFAAHSTALVAEHMVFATQVQPGLELQTIGNTPTQAEGVPEQHPAAPLQTPPQHSPPSQAVPLAAGSLWQPVAGTHVSAVQGSPSSHSASPQHSTSGPQAPPQQDPEPLPSSQVARSGTAGFPQPPSVQTSWVQALLSPQSASAQQTAPISQLPPQHRPKPLPHWARSALTELEQAPALQASTVHSCPSSQSAATRHATH
jgi:hypothetical protein